jgi:aminoglycoside phosphotransferase (APT) family kinase protein
VNTLAETELFEQLVQRIVPNSKLLRTWQLKGGVSAQVTALEIVLPDGQTKKMIVRRHGDKDLRRNPHVAADEFKLLQLLQTAGLATPKPYHLDQSGEIFSTPYIVIEYIEGKPEFTPSNLTDFILQLATHLAKIHSIDDSKLDLSFLPQQAKRISKWFGERPVLDEGRIREALESVWPLPQLNKSVLLHGDFWPGNILWKDGQLVGIIDWEDAELGDPLADLANSRLEILWAFGIDPMHSFTHHYTSMTTIDFKYLPYWDLYTALQSASKISGWGLNETTEKKMKEKLRLFITQALERI